MATTPTIIVTVSTALVGTKALRQARNHPRASGHHQDCHHIDDGRSTLDHIRPRYRALAAASLRPSSFPWLAFAISPLT